MLVAAPGTPSRLGTTCTETPAGGAPYVVVPYADSVDLAGWHLTDNPAILDKWTFPATNILPHGTLIVFASGRGTSFDRAGNLHANFRLEKNGIYTGRTNLPPRIPNLAPNTVNGVRTVFIILMENQNWSADV